MSIRLCVIGCGSMSERGHGPAFKKYAEHYGDTVLAACCDTDKSRAEAYKNKFGFLNTYTDYVKMLDAEKPDAVSIIVPEHLTAKLRQMF